MNPEVGFLRSERFYTGPGADCDNIYVERQDDSLPCSYGRVSTAYETMGDLALGALFSSGPGVAGEDGSTPYCVNRVAMACGVSLWLDEAETDLLALELADGESPSTLTLDDLIIPLARQQGYDTIQVTTQPNSYGGWTNEIIVLADDLSLPMFYHRLNTFLEVSDPCMDGSAATCNFQPIVDGETDYRCMYCGTNLSDGSDTAESCAQAQP